MHHITNTKYKTQIQNVDFAFWGVATLNIFYVIYAKNLQYKFSRIYARYIQYVIFTRLFRKWKSPFQYLFNHSESHLAFTSEHTSIKYNVYLPIVKTCYVLFRTGGAYWLTVYMWNNAKYVCVVSHQRSEQCHHRVYTFRIVRDKVLTVHQLS